MNHGVQQFFRERARSRRRVAVSASGLATLLLGVLGLLQLPPLQRALRESPVLRFGFEGPTRYVRLLQIDANPSREDAPTNVGRVEPLAAARRGGGAGTPRPGAAHTPARQGPLSLPGPGEDRRDLLARALASHGRVPIFQSEELIIDRLVRPTYPEEARDRGIEGRVAVLAHVDVTGAVVEAEVMTTSGALLLDRSAEEAVRRCHFRPYQVGGQAQEVYAVFRFRFRLTEP